MKLLGIILTGLLIGFILATPFWVMIAYTARGGLALLLGALFYGFWALLFPSKDEVKTTWEDK